MKAYGGVEVQLHSFLTSALDGGEWSTSRPSRFIPGKEPPFPSIEGWVGPRVSLDVMEKREISRPCEEFHPGSYSM